MLLSHYTLLMKGLVVFRGILKDPVVASMEQLLNAAAQDRQQATIAYANFCSNLFEHSTNWSKYLLRCVEENENLYIRAICTEQGANKIIADCLNQELKFLTKLSALTPEQVLESIPEGINFLPKWENTPYDFSKEYTERLKDLHRTGYGVFARYHVFTIEEGNLIPVKHPDPQRLTELPGYETERAKVIANTKALLEGLPTNNVLLYGDAGTGKSSAIKAIANEYAAEGLRLVEVKKNQLYQIPELMDTLATNPLKFILFIDDLSFTANDDNFAALKAILEGSVGGRSKNIAVYATSNRRHLIKEKLSDREGDDIHLSDTRQELMSLSARFGLTITFGQPDHQRFSHIVEELAAQYGITMNHDTLLVKAEAFAIRAGGRSPRVAKQFIELLRAGVLS